PQRAETHTIDAAARRHRRAAVARRLLAAAPAAAASLDWETLDSAPAWLALSDPELMVLARQVGAMLCAASVRLWIDGARLGAARAALGAPFLHALQALPDTQVLPRNVAPCPRIDTAEQVAPMLRTSGLGVLLASLPNGPLRRAATALLGSTALTMAAALAQALVSRAQTLTARPAPVRTQGPAAKSHEGVNA
ncbi:MAG TPA: hypothetical protein VLJ62_08185, partial [Burkholderiaceae bacterium]|nr:hypothetical protein [Burkholderiaceae bacterium]